MPEHPLLRVTDGDETQSVQLRRVAAAPSSADDDQTSEVSDLTSAVTDQTSLITDQTAAVSDQTSSGGDQATADRDHSAAALHQAANDPDLGAVGNPLDWEITRKIRLRSTQQRHRTARVRLDAANVRDELARSRDLAALERDATADARDRETDRETPAGEGAGGRADRSAAGVIHRVLRRRRRVAVDGALAAEHRQLASDDRREAALDRERAALERLRSLADREALAEQLAIAETDALTGARTRAAGLRELAHELERSLETDAGVVVVYVDVIGLKQFNDSLGHGAGDDLLRQVAQLFTSHLRSFDLVIRLGGDEFLCAVTGLAEPFVKERFGAIAAELAAIPDARGIRTGFASFRAGETAADLIARADADLVSRQRRPGRGPEATRG